jgi:hypothetical protein
MGGLLTGAVLEELSLQATNSTAAKRRILEFITPPMIYLKRLDK